MQLPRVTNHTSDLESAHTTQRYRLSRNLPYREHLPVHVFEPVHVPVPGTGTVHVHGATPWQEIATVVMSDLLESLLAGGCEVAPPPSPTMERRREQDVADKYARQLADYEAALRHFRRRISDATAKGDRLFAFLLEEQCNMLKCPTLERAMRRVEAQPEEEAGYAYGASTAAATASARAMAAAGVARGRAARRGRQGRGRRQRGGSTRGLLVIDSLLRHARGGAPR